MVPAVPPTKRGRQGPSTTQLPLYLLSSTNRAVAVPLLPRPASAARERQLRVDDHDQDMMSAKISFRLRPVLAAALVLALAAAGDSSQAFQTTTTTTTTTPFDVYARRCSFLAQDAEPHAAPGTSALQPSTAREVQRLTAGAGTRPVNMSHGLLLRTVAVVKWDTPCPKWMEEYATFHRGATRNYSAASTAKLMLHECNDDTVAGCPGLGDRFRGLMETLKFAVHSGRVFLLRWESSAPLEDVLQPALLDWRVQPKYKVDSIKDQKRYYWHKPEPRPDGILSGAFVNETNKLMSLTHADMDCRRLLPGPDIGCNNQVPATQRSCIFHALFKPSDNLAAYVAALRRQLFGSERRPYLAVHLRIGGFEGERSVVRGGLSAGNHSTAEVVASTLSAARDLAAASNLTAPILVLTDNDELRDRLQRGLMPGFVSPGYKAKHAAMARGEQHKEALLTSLADLLLLAQSSCFIGSPSGFTNTAFMWGRHSCFLMVNGDGQGGVGQHKSG